jgi:hypothetical protein
MSDETKPPLPTAEEYGRDELIRYIHRLAADLRGLAHTVELSALSVARVGAPGIPSYARVAARVQHDVLWGLANLSLDRLTAAAYDADAGRLQPLPQVDPHPMLIDGDGDVWIWKDDAYRLSGDAGAGPHTREEIEEMYRGVREVRFL